MHPIWLPKGEPGLASSISVAMCTFNGERHLAEQLESISAQSVRPEELVICDDGSTDRTQQMIQEFASRAPFPVYLFINAKNLGSTKNFEQAISRCRGLIVALADQDDIWHPNKLEQIAKIMGSDPVVGVFSDAALIDQNSQPLNIRLWPTFAFGRLEQKQFADGNGLQALINHPVVTGATMAFRKELFHVIAPIPPGEIHDRWISLILAASGRFEMITEPLMEYRRHSRQQIGPGPSTLRGRMEAARGRGETFYREEISRFQQILGRIASHEHSFPNAKYIQKEIQQKIDHLERRAFLPGKIARSKNIFKEMINGNYWRYSGGCKSILKDLIIR